ncbi:hypothetical protein ACFWXK_14055 [Streptomyces sp. NPDC059070]
MSAPASHPPDNKADLMGELRARALIARRLACAEAATKTWVRSDGTPDLQ